MTSAEGSFDSVSGVTSISTAGAVNSYSLQLNTEFFTTSTCNSGQSGCQGWEQFVFENEPPQPVVFIQYWLIGYGATCPSGWISYGSGDCWRNDPEGAAGVPQIPAASLGKVALIGATGDSATVASGNELYSITGSDYFPDLDSHWNTAEFNVLGTDDGQEGVFNAGSTLVVRTAVDAGTVAPTCVAEGFTAETNNLTLVGAPAVDMVAEWPSIVFTESNAGGSGTATCTTLGVAPVSATATSIDSGDSTTLSVTPSGTGLFTYQWYEGTSGDTGAPIAGATAASVTVTPSVTTKYWVQITLSDGQVENSETITITISTSGGSGTPPTQEGTDGPPVDGPLPSWAFVAVAAALSASVIRASRPKLPGSVHQGLHADAARRKSMASSSTSSLPGGK